MSRIAKLRESVHRRKNKLSELSPAMRGRVLARLALMVEQWGRGHRWQCPQPMRAILTGVAIRVESDRSLARRQAGRKSYRVRCERCGEDAVRQHMKNISAIGVAARRYQRETGHCWTGTASDAL